MGGGGGGGVFGLGQEASIQKLLRLLRDRGNTADSGRPLCEVLRLYSRSTLEVIVPLDGFSVPKSVASPSSSQEYFLHAFTVLNEKQ